MQLSHRLCNWAFLLVLINISTARGDPQIIPSPPVVTKAPFKPDASGEGHNPNLQILSSVVRDKDGDDTGDDNETKFSVISGSPSQTGGDFTVVAVSSASTSVDGTFSVTVTSAQIPTPTSNAASITTSALTKLPPDGPPSAAPVAQSNSNTNGGSATAQMLMLTSLTVPILASMLVFGL